MDFLTQEALGWSSPHAETQEVRFRYISICAECCCHDFVFSVQSALDNHDGEVVSVPPATRMIPESALLVKFRTWGLKQEFEEERAFIILFVQSVTTFSICKQGVEKAK
jgi:hypothetical protein